jgi:hypothetical protein
MGEEPVTNEIAASNTDAGLSGVPLHPRRPMHETGPRRFALVLVTVVASFTVQGIADPAPWEQVLVTSLLGLTVLLSLWVARSKRTVLVVAVVVVVATLVLSVVEAVNGNVDDRATRVANALLVALAPAAVLVGVIRTLRAKRAVSLEAVFGVLSVYMLLGMLYAFLYGAIDHVGGTPFFAQAEPATVSHCLYFSFTTMTTVGYGDLTAATNLGHTLSVSEALLGQIYLVTIVSLIVGNLGRRAESPPATEGGR